jgi:hypothetical protein
MADRYWVGGTDTWDATAGTKWATTSGGPGGASVPTAADDVFFDANSSGTCTIANSTTAKSINCTGFTGHIFLNTDINIYGSFILSAGMTYDPSFRALYLYGTGTLDMAGKNAGTTRIQSGANVTLASALSIGGDYRIFFIDGGTFTTNNYNVLCWSFLSNVTSARTINLGSSTITIRIDSGDFVVLNTTNLTFNAGTSTFANTSNNWGTDNISGNVNFYNMDLTWGSTRNFNSAMSFNNLTLGTANTGVIRNSFAGNITVNGTLNSSGSSPINRNWLFSNTYGTQRTFTVNAISATDSDFRDIALAGAASPATITRAGDCGGNSNITFPAPKNVYRVGSSNVWASDSWSLTSGGAVNLNNFPLAQDTAIVDNSSFNQLRLIGYNLGTLDASARTTALTLSTTNASPMIIYKDYIYGTGITCTLTGSGALIVFNGRNVTSTVTTLNKSTFNIAIDMLNGTCALGSAFTPQTTTGACIQLTRGTFATNNYTITCSGGAWSGSFSSGGSIARTVNAGTSLWLMNSRDNNNYIWNVSGSNLTWTATDAVLRHVLGVSDVTFIGGGQNYQNTAIDLGTSARLRIEGNNTFSKITNSFSSIGAAAVRFRNTQTQTFTNWLATGASGRVLTIDSYTAGSRANIVLTNAIGFSDNIDYLNIRDINVTQANKFYAGANSTNSGNNINVIFTAPPAPVISTGNMLMLFM